MAMGLDAKRLLSEELKPAFCRKRVRGAIALGAGAPDQLFRAAMTDSSEPRTNRPAPNFASAISWQKRNTVL
jgi:hypothetical protein